MASIFDRLFGRSDAKEILLALDKIYMGLRALHTQNEKLMASSQETVERIKALKASLDAKSTAEHAETLAAVDGLKARIQALRDQIGQMPPEIDQALTELEGSVDEVTKIFEPDAPTDTPPEGGENPTTARRPR